MVNYCFICVDVLEGEMMIKRRMVIVMIVLLIVNFMGGLDVIIVNIVLLVIISDLNGICLIGWISLIFLLGIVVMMVLWGWVGELIGNKFIF